MPRSRFVENGRQRAIEGIRAEVRQAVEAKYAEPLEQAGPLRRIYLRWQMAREITRRARSQIERMAPRDGLYFHDKGR